MLFTAGMTGCSPPDIKIVRPKKAMSSTTTSTTTTASTTTTTQPYVAFQTTQIYLPANFNSSDVQIVEKKDGNQEVVSQMSLNVPSGFGDLALRYGEANPFWWQEGVQNTASITTLSPEELEAKKERRRRRKENRRRRRRKQKHEEDSDHESNTETHRRRREVWNENYYQTGNYAEEIYVDPKDVEQNIFNANDTIHFANYDKTDNINLFETMPNSLSGNRNFSHNNKRDTSKFASAESMDHFLHQLKHDIDDHQNTEKDLLDLFNRHKRKSGKTTGALSRAKAGSSKGDSKTIDRHNKGGKFRKIKLIRFYIYNIYVAFHFSFLS